MSEKKRERRFMTFSYTYIVLPHRISYGTVAQASTCMEEALEWFNYYCASFTPNPNPQSASIYNQLHVLGFPCHMLVNSRSIGE